MEFFSFLFDHWLISTVVLILLAVAIYDVWQRKYTIKHNFPIVGHFRYWLEMFGPELRQYWVAHDKEEKPFNRSERAWIYTSAKGLNSGIGFGTGEQLYQTGYPIIKHSAFPVPERPSPISDDGPYPIPALKVIGESHRRAKPYRPKSMINISGMSFGALSSHAVEALNKGAGMAECYQNTGEGGISPYHTFGADLFWQIGTGYFGARDDDGNFSLTKLVETADSPYVRAIEIKLSQGAKAGKGGLLPGKKVTHEIAQIRGVAVGEDCVSPNYHSEFGNADELIDFIEMVAEATGLPVGIKSAVGGISFWEELSDKMIKRAQGPDFICIDGAEGGTGAAPLVFADHVSLPFKVGFPRVYRVFQAKGLSKDIVWIGSAKLGLPEYAIIAFTMGCDLIQIAREAMMAIGCIQTKRCHTDRCPTGVATQNKWLVAGLDVDDKAGRFARYIKNLRREILSISHAAGYEHPCQFTGRDIEISTGVNRSIDLEEMLGYKRDPADINSIILD